MKAAIMQPYFFPYIGYYSLIANTDMFIYFDTPQYIRKGWINRNRIINDKGEVNYITVPVKKCDQKTCIKDVQINYGTKWEEKLLGQLTAYKKRAPYYKDVIDMVKELFSKKYETISELSINSIKISCERIGLELKDDIFSQMNLEIDEVNEPDEWALYISKAIGADTYINPPGGIEFFHRDKYEKAGLDLQFLQVSLVPYVQKIGHFEGGLSIIDIMMFCKCDEIKEMCNNYSLL